MWRSYEEVRNQSADFRVKYRLYSQDEGGRKKPIYQGYRSDFSYDGVNISAIHPEFEDEFGNVILNEDSSVPTEGTARMWIIFPEMRRLVHLTRIKIGVVGYFMEGPRKIAEAEVIEILGLQKNAKLLT